jgi:uncharacterized phiE125 gp8 family phage protein
MPSFKRTKELLVVAPTIEPVSLEAALKHCRIDSHDDDIYVQSLVTLARETIEAECWCSMLQQTWHYWWDRFEWDMYIPRPPLIQSNFLKYLAPQATNNVWTVCPTTVYELSWHRQIPFYRIQYLQTWPVTRGYRDDVMCEVVTGYGANPSDVPLPLRQAILLLVAHLYANRGEVPAALPQAIDRLIGNYRFKEF